MSKWAFGVRASCLFVLFSFVFCFVFVFVIVVFYLFEG